MKEKLLTDIGENYEYVRTIVNNKIEIMKIDAAQNASKIIGYIVLAFLLLGISTIMLTALVAALAIYLASVFSSIVVGVLAASSILFLIIIVLFAFRRALIFAPVAKLFYSKIADKF